MKNTEIMEIISVQWMPFLGQESQDVQMDFVRIAPFVRFENVDKLTNVDVQMSVGSISSNSK